MRLKILVMARTNSHDIAQKLDGEGNPKGDPEAGRHRKWEPVDVFRTPETPEANGSPAFYNIYVSDWPHTLRRAKARILAPHNKTTDPDAPVARKKHLFEFGAPRKAALNSQGWIELTTAQLRNVLFERDPDARTRSAIKADLDS